MTKLKLTVDTSFLLDNRVISKGDIFDCPDARARQLLDLGHAVWYVEPKKEEKKAK